MVDVRVGRAKAPHLRIEREMPLHVLMDEPLQVDADGAVGAHHDVGAHARIGRNVAHRIADFAIAVDETNTGIFERRGRLDEPGRELGIGKARLGAEKLQRQDKADQSGYCHGVGSSPVERPRVTRRGMAKLRRVGVGRFPDVWVASNQPHRHRRTCSGDP
jgi:hypothetical protein